MDQAGVTLEGAMAGEPVIKQTPFVPNLGLYPGGCALGNNEAHLLKLLMRARLKRSKTKNKPRHDSFASFTTRESLFLGSTFGVWWLSSSDSIPPSSLSLSKSPTKGHSFSPSVIPEAPANSTPGSSTVAVAAASRLLRVSVSSSISLCIFVVLGLALVALVVLVLGVLGVVWGVSGVWGVLVVLVVLGVLGVWVLVVLVVLVALVALVVLVVLVATFGDSDPSGASGVSGT